MNHAISALKFKIIREFLELGWNVLLSDVDVILIQVPAPKSVSCTTGPACARYSCRGPDWLLASLGVVISGTPLEAS